MRTKSNSNKHIQIVLYEEKFYFPGETIRGNVIVHPKSPTKTNHITIKFTGEVQLSVRDKQSFTLFQKSQYLRMSADEKTFILEPKPNTFPFEFQVPLDKDLPSTMEYGKKAVVQYTLTAIHDRPMVPEAFSAKTEFAVPILEYLDIEGPQFKPGQEKTASLSITPGKISHLRVTTPHIGYARGSIVHVGTTLTFVEPLNVTKGLRVALVRLADIRSGRHRYTKQETLKSVVHDVRICGPFNFSQAISCQLMIPTSTPPTVCFQQTTIRIFYQIRVCATIDDQRKLEVHLPVVVGTWPRADNPIDDDDEYYEEDGAFMSDSLSEGRQSIASETFRYSISTLNSNHRASFASSHHHLPQPHLHPPPATILPGTTVVDRSDSNASKTSRRSHGSATSSCTSWDSQSLSGHTSYSMPDTPQLPPGSDQGNGYYRRTSRTMYDVKHVPILQPILSTPSTDLSGSISSDDDGDLFRILEKKKRATAKQLKEQMASQGI